MNKLDDFFTRIGRESPRYRMRLQEQLRQFFPPSLYRGQEDPTINRFSQGVMDMYTAPDPYEMPYIFDSIGFFGQLPPDQIQGLLAQAEQNDPDSYQRFIAASGRIQEASQPPPKYDTSVRDKLSGLLSDKGVDVDNAEIRKILSRFVVG